MTLPYTVDPIDLALLNHDGRLDLRENTPDATRALMALIASRMGSWSHYLPEDEIFGDRIVAELLGFDFDSQPWSSSEFYDKVHPEDRDRVGKAVEEAYSGSIPYYDVDFRRNPETTATGSTDVVWIGARAQVTERDEGGHPLRVIGVNWDVSNIKQGEHRLALLAAEMDHRVKNAFAVIRALINLAAETAKDTKSFADMLRTQVEAMASAHALSARMGRSEQSATAKVALAEIFTTALAPWIQSSGEISKTRITLDCDPDILLPPVKVAAFAMMLYELSTNATKYGPLGELGGSLSISVQRHPDGAISMAWVEELNSAFDVPPEKDANGFGEVLMQHCANNLRAKFTRQMTSRGFQLDMHMVPPCG